MDAQVVEVVGQEMAHSRTYRHGKDLVGSMDVALVGLWDIVPILTLQISHFQ